LASVVVWKAKKENYPREQWRGWGEFSRQLAPNIWAFMAPVIVLGGILTGIVTTTESAVIGCAYVLAVEFLIYRQLTPGQIGRIFANSAKMTSAALLILATASGYGVILTALRVPQVVGDWIGSVFHQPWMVLLVINLWFLVQGCFLDLLPGLFLAAPIFYPIALRAGMEPIQFGVMLTINLGIGLFTPPVGTVLYSVCILGGTKMEKVIPYLLPFFVGMVLILLLVTFWPPLTLWLGRI
jgi:tripartite ATP-independent transporter DctM subunit